MKTTHFFAIAALSAAAFGAHADEADGSQFSVQVDSQRSRAEVQAEARNPVKITNGGTGYIGLTQSGVERAEVRAQAAAAVRNGTIPQGEMTVM